MSQNADSVYPFLPSCQYKLGHAESANRDTSLATDLMGEFNLLSHAGLVVCLELESSAITLDGEGGVILVLLRGCHFLNTNHLVHVNKPGKEWLNTAGVA